MVTLELSPFGLSQRLLQLLRSQILTAMLDPWTDCAFDRPSRGQSLCGVGGPGPWSDRISGETPVGPPSTDVMGLPSVWQGRPLTRSGSLVRPDFRRDPLVPPSTGVMGLPAVRQGHPLNT